MNSKTALKAVKPQKMVILIIYLSLGSSKALQLDFQNGGNKSKRRICRKHSQCFDK